MASQLKVLSVPPLFLHKTSSTPSIIHLPAGRCALDTDNCSMIFPRDIRGRRLRHGVAHHHRDGYPLSKPSAITDFQKVRIQILDGCHMRISKHLFNYNGEGGEGIGYGSDYNVINHDSRSNTTVVPVNFDLPRVHMEPITSSNTNMNGGPFPPFTRIDIVPLQLYGNIDRASGKVELQFKGNFQFCVGFYKAPPILIDSVFTTEESHMKMSGTSAQRGDRVSRANGRCKLVTVAKLDAVGDQFLDSILDLPNPCLIVIRARMSFS